MFYIYLYYYCNIILLELLLYLRYLCKYIYNIYIVKCKVNMGLRVSEKSFFSASFGHGCFQKMLSSFEICKWLQKILFDVRCL